MHIFLLKRNSNLNCSIEQCREALNNLISEKKYSLLDNDVINLSQLLDDLIYKCILCENNLAVI